MNSGMLADLRADALRDIQENGDGTTATVSNLVKTQTDLGGESEEFVDGAVYPCLLQAAPKIPKETEQGGQITSMGDYVAKLPWNAVVLVTDHLKINGSEYEVLDVNRDQTERLTLSVSLKRPN